MIEVRVTVGIFDDLTKTRVFRMQLGSLPRLGEAILTTPEIRLEMEKRRKEWGVDQDTRMNYVKCIAHDQEPTPVVMLSTNPAMKLIDCIRGDGSTFSLLLPGVPRIGEEIVTPEEKQFYVDSIIYAPWGVFAKLSQQKPLPEVLVATDTPLSVEVVNSMPIEVYSRQLDREIEVHVNNRTLYVEGTRDY